MCPPQTGVRFIVVRPIACYNLVKTQYHAQQSFHSCSGGYKRLFFIDKTSLYQFFYTYLISILIKREDSEIAQKIEIEKIEKIALEIKNKQKYFFRWLIFHLTYFCLGLLSYKQKKLLSDIFSFLQILFSFFPPFEPFSKCDILF